MSGYTLGQRVAWDAGDELGRRYLSGDWYTKQPPRKRWVRAMDGAIRPRPEPRTGVVVGLRTLANGTVEHMGEDGTQFIPEEYIPAVLVAYDLRRKPVYVQPHLLRTLEES